MFMVVTLTELLPFFLGLIAQFETMHHRDDYFFLHFDECCENSRHSKTSYFSIQAQNCSFLPKMGKVKRSLQKGRKKDSLVLNPGAATAAEKREPLLILLHQLFHGLLALSHDTGEC